MSKVVKSGQTKSGKAFQLTLNQVECSDDLRAYLLGLKSLNYVIACKEVAPTTGHVHIHVYVQFMDSVKMSIAKLCGAHVGLFKLSGMMLDIEDKLNRKVDLVTDSGLMDFARKSVDKDKILIYERAK